MLINIKLPERTLRNKKKNTNLDNKYVDYFKIATDKAFQSS
jgi:hypothetical protein